MKTKNFFMMAASALLSGTFASCGGGGDDTPTKTPDPVYAGFEYTVADDSVVTFTNKSTGATTYAWDFGDGGTSTDENPVHTYTIGGAEATFSASLKASGDGGDDTKSMDVSVARSTDPNSPIQLLTGGDSKTWMLAPMVNAINFGPLGDQNTIWWGNLDGQWEQRACLFDNTFTFNIDGSYTRDINGSLWKEWKVFDIDGGEGCLDASEDAVTRYDHNVNDWKDGSFDFTIDNGDSTKIITVNGSGGYIGHYTSGVAFSDFNVHDMHTYSIQKITKDTLWLQSTGWGGDSDADTAPLAPNWDGTQPDRLVRLVLVAQ